MSTAEHACGTALPRRASATARAGAYVRIDSGRKDMRHRPAGAALHAADSGHAPALCGGGVWALEQQRTHAARP